MVGGRTRKLLGHTLWFKVVLTLAIFTPPMTNVAYDPAGTTDVIASVLAQPLIVSVPALLPVAKLTLLGFVLLPMICRRISGRIVLAYYGAVLILVGTLQNMAMTENYGFVWLIGNTIVQLSVAVYCLYDLAYRLTEIKRENIRRERLWVVLPMLVAYLMPYAVDGQGVIRPSFSLSVFWNEAGLTYCMITPVMIGVLLLFSKDVHKPLLSVISYVGLLFGLMNMITWFALRSGDWWMGILHLPLLILSLYGMFVAQEVRK